MNVSTPHNSDFDSDCDVDKNNNLTIASPTSVSTIVSSPTLPYYLSSSPSPSHVSSCTWSNNDELHNRNKSIQGNSVVLQPATTAARSADSCIIVEGETSSSSCCGNTNTVSQDTTSTGSTDSNAGSTKPKKQQQQQQNFAKVCTIAASKIRDRSNIWSNHVLKSIHQQLNNSNSISNNNNDNSNKESSEDGSGDVGSAVVETHPLQHMTKNDNATPLLEIHRQIVIDQIGDDLIKNQEDVIRHSNKLINSNNISNNNCKSDVAEEKDDVVVCSTSDSSTVATWNDSGCSSCTSSITRSSTGSSNNTQLEQSGVKSDAISPISRRRVVDSNILSNLRKRISSIPGRRTVVIPLGLTSNTNINISTSASASSSSSNTELLPKTRNLPRDDDTSNSNTMNVEEQASSNECSIIGTNKGKQSLTSSKDCSGDNENVIFVLKSAAQSESSLDQLPSTMLKSNDNECGCNDHTSSSASVSPLDELINAVESWIESVHELRDCKELTKFVQSTTTLTCTTAGVVVYTATLPIRIPYRIVTSTITFLIVTTDQTLGQSSKLISQMIVPKSNRSQHQQSTKLCNNIKDTTTKEEDDSQTSHHQGQHNQNQNPLSIVVRTAVGIPTTLLWNLPISAVMKAVQVTEDVVGLVASTLTGENSTRKDEKDPNDPNACAAQHTELTCNVSSFESSKTSDAVKDDSCVRGGGAHFVSFESAQEDRTFDFLDRLRLDFNVTSVSTSSTEQPHGVEVSRVHPQIVGGTVASTDTGKVSPTCKKKSLEKETATDERKEGDKSMTKELKQQESHCSIVIENMSLAPTVMKKSQHLLQVLDVGITVVDEKCAKPCSNDAVVSYLDLASDNVLDRALFRQALDRLVVRGLCMIANHPPARLSAKQYMTTPTTEIKWDPIGGSTKNVLRQMSQMTNKLDRLQLLQKETIMWAGEYKFQKGFEHECGRNFTVYLARGIIKLSPREFLQLMWDDSRTTQYNQYSNGRSTDLTIDPDDIVDVSCSPICREENETNEKDKGTPPIATDKLNVQSLISSSKSMSTTGTKTIRAETRVPLTKFTLTTKCLMHVRALDAPDDGYVIFTRSLDSGDAGIHYSNVNTNDTTKKCIDKCDNQILWGLNILRAVPNHPHLTDLISLSQVSTPNVPGFLGRRIAIMGIEDFFSNVRKVASSK